ncbi:Uncharacterized protein HZ326_31217 [Fusarium oxysporum f. sp. albedinis]|nr:Uncharacterized protein HZ326_31217 [Fusarium oxysporum f. sp. albedinis]
MTLLPYFNSVGFFFYGIFYDLAYKVIAEWLIRLSSISIKHQTTNKERPKTSPSAFRTMLSPEDHSSNVCNSIVVPNIFKVHISESCSFLCVWSFSNYVVLR